MSALGASVTGMSLKTEADVCKILRTSLAEHVFSVWTQLNGDHIPSVWAALETRAYWLETLELYNQVTRSCQSWAP